MSKHHEHHKKGHINWRDIDLFLEEKLSKIELSELKDKFKMETLREKKSLLEAKKLEDDFVFKDEYQDYMSKYEEHKKILDALRLIFPEDKELFEIEIELD